MRSLFETVELGSLVLNNRIFMAPLTRNRADADGVPGELAAIYYSQRATAGLIITEATQISPMGKGYINTPGIHSNDQVKAWRKIVDAVHREGGRLFLQLWHVGRISHTSLLPNNSQPVAPSAIRANAQTFISTGPAQVSEPVALTPSGIRETLEDYRRAALNAKEAGFDGVEVHAANGYLIDQFLRTGTNQRTDEYGGPASNRARFLIHVVEQILQIWDESRVGVRISPTGDFNDMFDDDPEETFGSVIELLNPYRLGYVHVVEASQDRAELNDRDRSLFASLRKAWEGFYIANGNYDGPRADNAIEEGRADAIAFGRLFLANPDLPLRLKLRAPLNTADPQTFYGGDSRGYTDYQFLVSTSYSQL